jgi:ubiquinone/menaquinone biosynthesis C-methylase UbiE
MRIQNPEATTICDELELIGRYLPMEGVRVLELGCGRARMTRAIAERFPIDSMVATEVDRIQHEKNLMIDDLPRVEFRYGGAEAIDAADGSFDRVFMFKSLHHVPPESMAASMAEIARVLKPGGLAWISEPVYAGPFNDILRLFHDEKEMREAAFTAVREAVDSGLFELERQIFCSTQSSYRDFADFEDRILKVTHTRHRLDEALYREVRERFMAHMGEDGARFDNPIRVDLLRKP